MQFAVRVAHIVILSRYALVFVHWTFYYSINY